MDREAFFISKLVDSGITYNIGDDGVLIDDYVYAMDLFCEGVHFIRKHFSYYQIAKKAMLVNISDILAMGVKPQYALLGISFSSDMNNRDIVEFQRGIIDICNSFKIKIIGGDTIKDNKLNIAITMFGKKGKYILSRSGFKAGDIVYYSGNLGSVKKDMRLLYSGMKIQADSKFYVPHLREQFIYAILPFVRGGMDISDGLFYELNRLSVNNNIRFTFFNKINLSIFSSGEEYELLFSIRKKDTKKLQMIAKKHRVTITKLAQIHKGRQRFHCLPHHK